MIYIKLFWSFFQIGLFSIGGGYAAMPLIQNQVIELNHWLTQTEFTDIITISQMTPGPIAINCATFVGIKIAGVGGAIVCTLGCILPSCIIVSLLAFFYYKYKDLSIIQGALEGLRPAVIALIASAGLAILVLSFWGVHGFTLNISDMNFVSVGLFTFSLIILRKFKPNPIYVIASTGVIGTFIYLLK
jgi:chromate transporter